MSERRCRYCEKTFQPSKHQPRQTVCGQTECQKKRRSESRQQKLASDGEYRQVCLDSACKWRAANPEYWKRYREKNPESVPATGNNSRTGIESSSSSILQTTTQF